MQQALLIKQLSWVSVDLERMDMVIEGTRGNGGQEQERSGRRSRLNLPGSMSVDRLRVDVSSRLSHVSNAGGLSTPSPTRSNYSDRFIPSRSSSNFTGLSLLEKSPTAASPAPGNVEGREDGSAAYTMLLRSELLGSEVGQVSPSTPEKSSRISGRDPTGSPLSPAKNLFRYKSETRSSAAVALWPESPYPASPTPGLNGSPRTAPRKISRSPYKVLDAPALQDDFYLNLVDWSSSNILAVGLGTCVYLWNASTSKVTKLCDLGPHDGICSVGWSQRGTYLAVGTSVGDAQIWDVTQCKRLRTMGGHRTRVGTLAWNSRLLSSGSRDRKILQRDIRVQDDFISKLVGHKSEVCGLKWSYDDRELASGGNDNQLLVWNQTCTLPVLKFGEHTAAVKAIAWSPHQHGLLASGGGTADRCIRFWNTSANSHLNCVDTGSQVCSLVWSKNVNELVSTHGYSQNQINVWRYPAMTKLATLTGHSYRVLYLSMSPDGQSIVTGAGDETLRFWNVFPSPKSQNAVRDTGIWSLGRTHIR